MNGQVISIGAAAGVLVALTAWSIWRIFSARSSPLDHPAIFFALVFGAILVLRLPQIGLVREINPDESQMVAQAMRYAAHPVPWRDVDGTTAGPLDTWALNAAMLAGAPASWATARTVFWALQCATLLLLYLALRTFGTRAEAQLSLMPTVLFYGFALNRDFIHYSSETLPVLLLAAMMWLLARAWKTGQFGWATSLATGFLAGCIPFAKLQASPMAGLLLGVGLAQIVFGRSENRRRKACLMLLGTVVLPALLIGLVAASGAGADFWKSYILAPAAYAREGAGSRWGALWTLITYDTNFRSYLVSALAVGLLLAAAWCYVKEPRPGAKLLWPLAVTAALGMTAVFCIASGGKGSGHYLFLLIPPLTMFFGLALVIGKTLLLAPAENDPNLFPKPVHWFLGLFAVIVCLQFGKMPVQFNTMRNFLAKRLPDKKSFVAQQILKASRPGDTLSVWGWMPSYYVMTGLMPATRDAIGHFVIEEGPYRAYFQSRYLNDLQRSAPAIFVDAAADGMFTPPWARLSPHEMYVPLARFIDENYSLWLTVHIGASADSTVPVRIYVRKPRMAELHLSPEELIIPTDELAVAQ